MQQKVREHFKNAHYVHCYAHQLNLIMQQATSNLSKVKVFFSELSGISSFFSRSPKRTSILDQVVARRLPRASATRWNFNSRIVNTVSENRADLIECFETIKTSFDQPTVREASGFIRMLQDEDFIRFFLERFSQHHAPCGHPVPATPAEGHRCSTHPAGPPEVHKQCAGHKVRL